MRIYVASSWRNKKIGDVVAALRNEGHAVYDFREDDEEGAAFNWSDIDPDWQSWSPAAFKAALDHTRARAGFKRDFDCLKMAEAIVLVMPCGRSAHLELGYAIGAGKPSAILMETGEPELCYKMAGHLCVSLRELLDAAWGWDSDRHKHFSTDQRIVTKSPF